MAPKSGKETKAVAQVLKPIYDAIREMEAFKNRGLSHRTIKALVDCGIDAPERILFMQEAHLRQIPGVGAASMKELKAYRSRFIVTSEALQERSEP
jgi:DNA-directed RNA polymerase alpha subunit